MKVRILIMFLCLTQFLFVGAQNVDFNEQKDLELKEVIELPNLTKQQIFVAVQSLLSDWHPNTNSQSSIDYADLETGTIITKGKYWVGFHKTNSFCGYDFLANYSCTIRMKDGRAQVIIKVPSIVLHWSANNTDDEVIDVQHVYPTYDGYKTRHNYTKKPMTIYGPQVPDAIRIIFNAIKQSLVKLVDDF